MARSSARRRAARIDCPRLPTVLPIAAAGAYPLACRHVQQPLCAAPRQARRQLPAAEPAAVPGAGRRRTPAARAVVHGAQRVTYARVLRPRPPAGLGAGRAGIGPGDTVSVMLANTPPMLEAHYGVPMTGAVLHAINTRLDAAIVAFQLDHAAAKVVICDREFAPVMREALAQAKVRPLVIDYDDRSSRKPGEPLSGTDYEAFLAGGDPAFRWRMPGDEWDAIALNYTSGTTGNPRASSIITAAPTSCATPTWWRPAWAGTPSISGRCRCSTATAGAFPGRCRWSPARTCASGGCAPAPMYGAIAEHKVTHLCGAPIVMSTLLGAKPEERRAAAAKGAVRDRRGAAAGGRARRHGRGGVRRDARLRPDRGLRPRRRQRVARGLGRACPPTSRRR